MPERALSEVALGAGMSVPQGIETIVIGHPGGQEIFRRAVGLLFREKAKAIAARHLADVKEKIAGLQALRTELSRMTAECAGGRVSACKVIEVLHDHGSCSQDHATKRPPL